MTIPLHTTNITANVSELRGDSRTKVVPPSAAAPDRFTRTSVLRRGAITRCGAVQIVLLAVAVGICGCGGGSGSPHPVEPTLARQTLTTVLEGWKEQPSLERWREQHTDIVVQDMDWLMGNQLTSFEVLEEGRAVDANLHCDVRLTLVDANRKSTEKTVTYLVGTSPKLTVFRQIIP
ncbi:MAG: hypothetical protein R3C59_26505 [Planctomycetaceae bacterium]